MNGTVILLIVIFVTYLIGKYAIEEGHRIERRKKFNKNLDKYK